MVKKALGKQKKDWFKLKKYPHIGFPLKAKDRFVWIEDYIKNPDNISKHSFLPFIHKTSKVRKFRKIYSSETGVLVYEMVGNKKHTRYKSEKPRELYYAGHLDTLVFSYYSEKLSKKYEDFIQKYSLDDVVTAYRTVPINKEKPKSGNKSNLNFANDVFQTIDNYPSNNFVAIAFDIKGFFDNLNHKILRDNWKMILNESTLPPDHFNVYKNITRFSYIDVVDIFNTFQTKIFVQKKTADNKLAPIKRQKVSRIKYLKNQNAIAFCTPKEFLDIKFKLIKKITKIKDATGQAVTKDFGIPQGSAISSTLANIYMLEFDKAVNDYITPLKGCYRRYSDDMVVICPLENKISVVEFFNTEIDKIKLEIQDAKTQIFHFIRDDDKLVCGQEFTSCINWNKNFIYLGFEYDGTTVRIKSASISNYYRKMKRNIRSAKNYASNRFSSNHDKIFKARILKRFSYKGSERRRKYLLNKKTNHFEISHHYIWGNFLAYTKKAANKMMGNKINQQTKKHWNKLNQLLKVKSLKL
ncbi:reverse transcriptase domain-containing protein [Flavobacterium sp. 120]|uniref:reverse transcriptase domain-containing protein n=1 Tax=Flavobacterium sp. 120 TaxID=2135626 RepID=UPI000EB38C40|nr:reverse transcriptase domain-containing protein [Flavobacterium sp. 120]RKS12847.1 reverse transcriptase (RNA-dependent DNA polymerase) [Flavobacterium sp. 120]